MEHNFDLHIQDHSEKNAWHWIKRKSMRRGFALFLSIVLAAGTCMPTLAAEQPKLADGIAVQQGGSEVAAAYTSTIGYIAGAEFGAYTLLVYCPSNITNGYLSGRYSYKQLEYGAGNYQHEDKCLFVWEDMSTKGGFYDWETP